MTTYFAIYDGHKRIAGVVDYDDARKLRTRIARKINQRSELPRNDRALTYQRITIRTEHVEA